MNQKNIVGLQMNRQQRERFLRRLPDTEGPIRGGVPLRRQAITRAGIAAQRRLDRQPIYQPYYPSSYEPYVPSYEPLNPMAILQQAERMVAQATIQQAARDRVEKVRRKKAAKKIKRLLKKLINKDKDKDDKVIYQNTVTYNIYSVMVNNDGSLVYDWAGASGSSQNVYYTKQEESIATPFDIVPNVPSIILDWQRNHKKTPGILLGEPDEITDTKGLVKGEGLLKNILSPFGGYKYVYEVLGLKSTKIRMSKADLKDRKLFNASVKLDHPSFNGFEDSGEMMCVPEVVLHHLTKDGRHKKLKLQGVIDKLDGKDAREGFSARQLAACLTKFKCHYKLLDIHEKVFLKSEPSDPKDRHLKTFVGLVFGQHIYYCTDDAYVKSLGQVRTNSACKTVVKPIIEEEAKEFTGVIKNIDDISHILVKKLFQDNVLVKASVYNGKVVQLFPSNEPTIVANPEGDFIKEVCKKFDLTFTNQSTTKLSLDVFNKLYPSHEQSKFLPTTFDSITKPAQIVRHFANPSGVEQLSVDINKCRTSCLLHNKLGQYPIFDYTSRIEDYCGNHSQLGWYYTMDVQHEFIPSNVWLSGEFLSELDKREVEYKVKYQMLAARGYPEDYLVEYVNKTVENVDDFKFQVNSFIGCLGRHIKKNQSGYIELDPEIAQAKFWGASNDHFGKLKIGKDGVSQKQVCEQDLGDDQRDVFEIFTIECRDWISGQLHPTHPELYAIQQTNIKKVLTNDVPLYNKVIENEWLKLMELREMMGGNLLAIKTDNVVCEYPDHNDIPNIDFSNDIGGYKQEAGIEVSKEIKEVKSIPEIVVDTPKWDSIEVLGDDHLDNFKALRDRIGDKSLLVTALAGYGKSRLAENLDYFNDDTTIKLAFTNKAAENLNAETICSVFGINFDTGTATKKKMESERLRNCKHIIVDEVFMVPPYCMNVLVEVKMHYPDIKWVCLGDDFQTKPIGTNNLNWLKTHALNFLCDGNMCTLVTNMRNDFDDEYIDIISGKFDTTPYRHNGATKVHLVKTNKMRKEINENAMQQYVDTYPLRYSRMISQSIKNHYGQDTWVYQGLPVMCIVNDKKQGLVNSNLTEVEQVLCDSVVIDGKVYSDDDFTLKFVPAYAYTNHKVQGVTIRVPFTIHEWDKMAADERYTAFSRCGLDRKDVTIIR